MYENHQKLKHARNDSRNLELGYNNLFQRVEQEVQKNSHLEHEVKNYEERQRHLEKIKLLEMKKPWVVSLMVISELCKLMSMYVSYPKVQLDWNFTNDTQV